MKINIVMGPYYPIPPVRGLAVERRQYALAREYIRRGHQVTIISRRFDGFPFSETEEDGLSHIRVKSWDAPKSRILYYFLDVIYILRVRLILPKADVTVTNSISAPLLLPKSRGGALYVSVGRFPKGQMSFYKRVSRLQAVSHSVGDAICRQSPKVQHLVRVINNPISETFSDAAAKAIGSTAQGARRKEIVFLGRIAREKGVHLLIEAFKRLSPEFDDWVLHIIGPSEVKSGGDGEEYLDELKFAARPLGKKISFDGPIYDVDEIVTRLQAAEIFVYPSVAEKGEAFGIAPLEAMACGCSVIVSDLECFRDFVEPGVSGMTFDHRDDPVTHLADVCLCLMRSPRVRSRLGSAALRKSLEFSPSVIAERLLDDFESLTI